MKKHITFFATFFLVHIAASVSAQSLFLIVYYDSLHTGIQANDMVRTNDNGYLIAGQGAMNKSLIIKLDSAGNLLWNKTIAGGTDEAFNAIIATADSGFVLAGRTFDSTTLHYEALCVKINSKGDTVWSKAIQQSGRNNVAMAVQQAYDYGYILTGYSADQNFNTSDLFAAKLDAKGELEWTNIVKLGNSTNIGFSARQIPDSGYVITGFFASFPPYDQNAFLIKFMPHGNISWAKEYNLKAQGECSEMIWKSHPADCFVM